jgi:hypothetical protein
MRFTPLSRLNTYLDVLVPNSSATSVTVADCRGQLD